MTPITENISQTLSLNQRIIKVLGFFAIPLTVVAFDQLTKHMIRTFMELGESLPADGFFRLTYTTNTGGAFSIFANYGFLLTIVAVLGVVMLVIYLRFLPLQSTVLKVGLGLDLGGAIGNMIDRLRFGEVTDFIDIGPWPVFNVADSCIVIGTILIAYHLLFQTGWKKTDGPSP